MPTRSLFPIGAFLSVVCLVLVFLFLHFFGLASLSRSFDSAVLKAGVERVYWLDGSFYTTMFSHKGPSWAFVHWLAYLLGKADYFWEAVGLFILGIALLKGGLFFLCTRLVVANPWFRFALILPATLYLLSGTEEFSYRLYSRNISELFLLIAATILGYGFFKKWPLLIIAMGSAAFLGQAVLIMPTAVISGGVIASFFLWELKTKPYLTSKERYLIFGIFLSAGLFSVLSNPLWYWVRGEFQEFWNGWYVYNQFYTEATQQTFGQIFKKGVNDFITHPLAFAQVLLCFIDAFLVIHITYLYKKKNRLFCRMLWVCYGWCLGGILQIILSQRFFGHYLICFVLPLLLMNTFVVLFYLKRFEHKSFWKWIPSIILLLGAGSVSAKTMFVGMKHFSNFNFYHDPHTLADRIDLPLYRKVKLVQHFTDPEEFMYIWGAFDMRLWEHYQRPIATRYVQQRWLIGRIYGGGISEKWILPGTWQKWEKDLETAQPKTIVLDNSLELDSLYTNIENHPRLKNLIQEKYQQLYTDKDSSIFVEKERLKARKDSLNFQMPENHYREGCEGQEFSIIKKEEHYQLSYAIRSVLNSRHFLIEVDKTTLTSDPLHLYFLFKRIKNLRLEFLDSETIQLHWELYGGNTKVCRATRLF